MCEPWTATSTWWHGKWAIQLNHGLEYVELHVLFLKGQCSFKSSWTVLGQQEQHAALPALCTVAVEQLVLSHHPAGASRGCPASWPCMCAEFKFSVSWGAVLPQFSTGSHCSNQIPQVLGSHFSLCSVVLAGFA